MKLRCDCGNEEEFNPINEDTGEVNTTDEEEGQYVTMNKFNFWEQHDQVGIVCTECDKSIWLFT